MKNLMLPGLAFNCRSVLKKCPHWSSPPSLGTWSLLPPTPSTSIQLYSELFICIAKVLLYFFQVFQWHLSILWSDPTSFFVSVSLRGESGPRGRRFRCCLRFLWRSSGETRQPSWPPAVACVPPVSASLPRPKKRWMKSLHSSHGPALVVPYRASLTREGPPSPRPVVLEWWHVTDRRRQRREYCAKRGERTKDRNKMMRKGNKETVLSRFYLFRQVL